MLFSKIFSLSSNFFPQKAGLKQQFVKENSYASYSINLIFLTLTCSICLCFLHIYTFCIIFFILCFVLFSGRRSNNRGDRPNKMESDTQHQPTTTLFDYVESTITKSKSQYLNFKHCLSSLLLTDRTLQARTIRNRKIILLLLEPRLQLRVPWMTMLYKKSISCNM